MFVSFEVRRGSAFSWYLWGRLKTLMLMSGRDNCAGIIHFLAKAGFGVACVYE